MIDEIKARMEVPKGHFCRGMVDPAKCHNCGRLHSEHLHTDEASLCPTGIGPARVFADADNNGAGAKVLIAPSDIS